jgi:hypothetical protein
MFVVGMNVLKYVIMQYIPTATRSVCECWFVDDGKNMMLSDRKDGKSNCSTSMFNYLRPEEVEAQTAARNMPNDDEKRVLDFFAVNKPEEGCYGSEATYLARLDMVASHSVLDSLVRKGFLARIDDRYVLLKHPG